MNVLGFVTEEAVPIRGPDFGPGTLIKGALDDRLGIDAENEEALTINLEHPDLNRETVITMHCQKAGSFLTHIVITERMNEGKAFTQVRGFVHSKAEFYALCEDASTRFFQTREDTVNLMLDLNDPEVIL